jgi:hypothetical protein
MNDEIENLVDKLQDALKAAGYEHIAIIVSCDKGDSDQTVVNDARNDDLSYAIMSAQNILFKSLNDSHERNH